MKQHREGSLRWKLLRITVVPLFIMGLLIILFTYLTFTSTMQKEVKRGLKSVALMMCDTYDEWYPGDYTLQKENGTYNLYKGKQKLSGNYSYIDKIKEDTGVDVTIFFYNTREITTLKDTDGNRIINTAVHPQVVKDVFEQQKEAFYNSVQVNQADYFAYYAPIYNADNTCVGMVFAGKPAQVVNQEILSAQWPILLIAVIMMILTGILCGNFATELVRIIQMEKRFLKELSSGNLKAGLDERIMKRNDELGEMGRFMVHVQKFLKEMVERDGLTKLYSRRIGETKLERVQSQAVENGTEYCVAIADIDFFKQFNDEYGHDCGDLVLREIATIFNHAMEEKGFAVRWGGEEFLLVYEDMELQQAKKCLDELRMQILKHEIEYREHILHITMTFGLTQGKTKESIEKTIKEADNRLYNGKMGGRNCIISE